MRLYYLLTAALLTLTSATLEDQDFTINYGSPQTIDLLRSIASASSANNPEVTALLNQLKEQRNMPLAKKAPLYETVCETSADFSAEIYPLNPEDPHPELAWAIAEIESHFSEEPYPGDYNSPMHPDGFRIVRADYDSLPRSIRVWIESHPEQKFFCVVDGVAFFAPAVILEMLGLFAGEGEGECLGKCFLISFLVLLWTREVICFQALRLKIGQFSTDPEVYLKKGTEDVIYTAQMLGSAEIGNNLVIKAVARKQVKKDVQESSLKDEL